MNTPNKLTLARMIATPIFMATMLIEFPYHYLVSLVLFAAASLTDMIDGKMARKYNLVTDFGKFLEFPESTFRPEQGCGVRWRSAIRSRRESCAYGSLHA